MSKKSEYDKREKEIDSLVNVMLEHVEILKYDNKISNAFISYLLLKTYIKFMENNYSDSKRMIKQMLNKISFYNDNSEEIVYLY
jgi:Ni,Fe-hydrogenase I cytochrome b subunit